MVATRVQIILHTDDNVPANFISNSFCIETENYEIDYEGVRDAFKAAYDEIGQGNWSSELSQGGHEIKLSQLPGVEPNYPFYEDTWAMAAQPNGNPQPPEVALVLSFQGIKQAGLPQNRRRGRIYLGPLSVSSITAGRPSSTLITELLGFAGTLYEELEAIPVITPHWAVWSPTDQAAVLIDNGWVDNEFDTQRRRGRTYTQRSGFQLP